jgi:hypothetical protein
VLASRRRFIEFPVDILERLTFPFSSSGGRQAIIELGPTHAVKPLVTP